MTTAPLIAAAPVSYGVFGAVGGPDLALTPRQLLAQMAEAGYAGSELGPPGFFGTPQQTARAFAEEGLAMVAAYMPLHLSAGEEVLRQDREAMDRSLPELAAGGTPGAIAVLADEGDPELIRHPFRDQGERGLTAAQWEVAVERLEAARLRASAYGVEVSFHPHYGTYVEQPGEIDALMAASSVGLCFDAGHFLIGGADPVAYAAKYASRINHVHVKDLRLAVAQRARAERNEDFEGWWEDLCCPFGTGDVDLVGVVRELRAAGYRRWWVVEQDRGAVTDETWRAAVADQRANLGWLRATLG
ncbi:MAG: sugar phosphate isomerase/epimerase [Bifidobacteriaceae bacterium]|jgi:inosose dehydratase|nr:sugar phosphate isomerase/epimerase [Bifidobacteriaceae bacterium]